MANNLLDTIRQTSGQLASQKQGVTDETAKAAALLRAKSGKASAAGPVAASNLGEQQAVAQTNETMQNEVAPQATLQQQSLEQAAAGVEQQEQEQRSTIEQANRFNGIQARIQTTQLLNDMSRRGGELDMQRDGATLQQIATNLRMQNDKYINQLQQEGNRARLDDANAFNEELLRTSLGDSKELLEKQLANKSILAASDREYQKALANMGIEDARALLRASAREQERNAVAGAVGNVAKQGAGMAGSAYAEYNSPNNTAIRTSQAEKESSTSDYAKMQSAKGY